MVLSIALLALLVIEFNSRMTELNELTAESEIVEKQLEGRIETKTALEEQIAFATSDAAVIRWAHEDGHMVKPGEFPVIPIQSVQITPTPIPEPEIIPTQISNIEKWLSLFIEP